MSYLTTPKPGHGRVIAIGTVCIMAVLLFALTPASERAMVLVPLMHSVSSILGALLNGATDQRPLG